MKRWVAAAALLAWLTGPVAALVDWGDRYTCVSTCSGAYIWSVKNESYTHALTDWRWAGRRIGELAGAELLEAQLPLLPVQPAVPNPWYQVAVRSGSAPVIVESTLYWDDGETAAVAVYIPAEMVPEPGGMLALGLGLAWVWKRLTDRPHVQWRKGKTLAEMRKATAHGIRVGLV